MIFKKDVVILKKKKRLAIITILAICLLALTFNFLNYEGRFHISYIFLFIIAIRLIFSWIKKINIQNSDYIEVNEDFVVENKANNRGVFKTPIKDVISLKRKNTIVGGKTLWLYTSSNQIHELNDYQNFDILYDYIRTKSTNYT